MYLSRIYGVFEMFTKKGVFPLVPSFLKETSLSLSFYKGFAYMRECMRVIACVCSGYFIHSVNARVN